MPMGVFGRENPRFLFFPAGHHVLWMGAMCGFSGRIIPRGITPARHLQAGLPWLARRGPDNQGFWSSPDGRVELLHTRLAIVDTSAKAHQPLWHPERQVALVFVGEIYNFTHLRTHTLAGYPFQSDSDSEVILALYLTHGLSALARLKGMFSMAIVDLERQRVFLIRDGVGKKPLFVARWHGQILFGVSLLPLLAAVGMEIPLDANVVADYWREGVIPPQRSVFRGAEPVRPGEIKEFNLDGVSLPSGTCLPESTGPVYRGESIGQVEAMVGDLLQNAIRSRLHNNPNPAILLSGGVDSTVIAQELKKICPSPLHAFTLGSMLPWLDDEPYARYAAHRLGLSLTIVRPPVRLLKPVELAQWVCRCIDLQDEPFSPLSFVPLCQLIEKTSQHSRIVFGGDGGDEAFLGYDQTRAWYQDDLLPNPCNPMASGPQGPEWLSLWGQRATGWDLLGHHFVKLDRATAEQGVEARSPYLDWDLMRYLRSLPPECLLVDGRSKGLLKRRLHDWPDWFVHRRKVGFAWHLRWAWGMSGFAGLRELIDAESLDWFGDVLPPALRPRPTNWSHGVMFRHFVKVWKLACWSGFIRRTKATQNLYASPPPSLTTGLAPS